MNNKRLDALLLAETIRLVETDGPLDDAEANRHASSHAGREERLLERAAWLSRRLGLDEELQAWRTRAGLIRAALALLVFLAGYGLVENLLGDGRTINAVLAFLAALGAHVVSLALWLISFCFGGKQGTSALARLSLGNLSLWLAARTASSHIPHSRQLLPAMLSILERARLLPWLFGLISHAVWAGAFLLALLGLWFMFSFREYRLTWETTIQGSEFFLGFIEATGVLPRHLGFPAPDQAMLAGAGGAARHRALAYWLMGCTFTYGLLPRVLLALLCATVLARRRNALRLDATEPYYRKVTARIDSMSRTRVVDPETPPVVAKPSARAAAIPDPRLRALVGYELPPECAWPPAGMHAEAALSMNLSGAGDQLRDALQKLCAVHPARILFVCDGAASPDRGTARFMRQAAACGGQASLLLLPLRGAAAGRWQAWLAASGLQDLQAFDDAAAASAWLEGAHQHE